VFAIALLAGNPTQPVAHRTIIVIINTPCWRALLSTAFMRGAISATRRAALRQ